MDHLKAVPPMEPLVPVLRFTLFERYRSSVFDESTQLVP
jgi:hypothetical protein